MKRPLLLLPLLALALPSLAQDPATNAPLVTRSYRVAPTIEEAKLPALYAIGDDDITIFTSSDTISTSDWLREYAAERGVSWPVGSELAYLPSIGQVRVRNTETNHTILRDILAQWSTDRMVAIGLRCLVSDADTDPFAALPTVRDADRPADAPAVRARVVETEAFAPLLAAAKSIRVHDDIPHFTSWGRRQMAATVSHEWRVPKCFSTTVAWNVVAEEPGTNGLSRVSLKATLSGNPDPDAERISAHYAATASLALGGTDQLLLGPVPAGNISTNPNAVAWFAVTVTPAWLADEDPFAPDFHAESADDESHAESAENAEVEPHAEAAEGAE